LQDSERFFGYKKELFQFVYQRRADVSGRDRVLTEQAYGYTLSHIEPRKMVSISRWTAGIIITFLALLAISQILWLWQSWPLREALETGASAAGVSK
jgi:type VI secretion system protein ImpK